MTNLERIRKQLSPTRRKKIRTLAQDLISGRDKEAHRIQIQPNVEGFTRAMLRHLDAYQRAELMGRLIMISREDRCDLEDAHAALKECL